MLCIARRTGAGRIPGTSCWEVIHCADEPNVVGIVYHVLPGNEPGSAEIGLFEFEPADQFLRSGWRLEQLIASPLAIVPVDKPLVRTEGAIWATVTICGTPHDAELLEVVDEGGRQRGVDRFQGRLEALRDFTGATTRLPTIQYDGREWALSIVPHVV